MQSNILLPFIRFLGCMREALKTYVFLQWLQLRWRGYWEFLVKKKPYLVTKTGGIIFGFFTGIALNKTKICNPVDLEYFKPCIIVDIILLVSWNCQLVLTVLGVFRWRVGLWLGHNLISRWCGEWADPEWALRPRWRQCLRSAAAG